MLHVHDIRTARLTLRAPRLDDVASIYAHYAGDPVVTRYLQWLPHESAAATGSFLARVLAENEHGNPLSWALCLGAEDRVLGMLTLRLHGHRAELGYVLAHAAWGKGYMPEAAGALSKLALEQGLYRIEANCDVDNVQSARVLEKIGMTREGLLRRYAVHPNISNEPRDAYLYAVCR
jgi:RimJ/RimL family protein N-acetyltransferase